MRRKKSFNGGKFRNAREKLRKKKKEAARRADQLAAAEGKGGLPSEILEKGGKKLIATPTGIFKVSAEGHIRGKLKPKKLQSLRDGSVAERKFVEWAKSAKGQQRTSAAQFTHKKKMSSTSSDDGDAERMAALSSVAVDSATVVQGAADFAKGKRRRPRGAPKPQKAKHRIGDSSDDEDPELAHYQTRTQDLLYRHLDKTFGEEGGDDSSEEREGGGTEGQPQRDSKRAKHNDQANGVSDGGEGEKQESLSTVTIVNENKSNGLANEGGSGEGGGIRLFKSWPVLKNKDAQVKEKKVRKGKGLEEDSLVKETNERKSKKLKNKADPARENEETKRENEEKEEPTVKKAKKIKSKNRENESPVSTKKEEEKSEEVEGSVVKKKKKRKRKDEEEENPC